MDEQERLQRQGRIETAMVAELRARVAQLETTGRALLEMLDEYGEIGPVDPVVVAFRAVLDGNATSADTEDPDA